MKESGGKVVVRVEGLRGQRKSRGREGVLERMRTVNPDQQPRCFPYSPHREDLLLGAVVPAQQGEKIDHGGSEEALRLELAHRGGAMPV